jgi:predicted nucleic acid-binding protein
VIFVDANLFIAAFVEPQNQPANHFHEVATAFLQAADDGKIAFTTSDAVLAEVAFSLTSKKHYNVPVVTAAAALNSILRARGFRHRDKRVLQRAIEIWLTFPRIGFVDALTAAYAQSPDMLLASFDSDFDPLPGIRRWTPD